MKSLTESFELEGKWWLPNDPNNKIEGKLIFNPGYFSYLELSNVLPNNLIQNGNISYRAIGRHRSEDIFLGKTKKDEKITLLNCSTFLGKSFDVQFVFSGDHFQSPDDIKFNTITIDYSYIDVWAKKYISNPNSNSNITLLENENIRIVLELLQNDNHITLITRFISPKLIPLDKYFEYMHSFSSFLSFGVTRPVYPIKIRGVTYNNNEVEIYYGIRGMRNAIPNIKEENMLFRLSQISDKIHVIFRNWYDKEKSLGIVYSLYLDTLYNPEIYLKHEFLNISQALEVLHHQTSYNDEILDYKDKYLTDEEYKTDIINKLKTKVLDGLSNSQLKQRLENYIKYGNYFSLRRRIKELFDRYDIVNSYFKEKNLFVDNKDRFIRIIVDTRNYLTHWDEDIKKDGNVVKDKELFWIKEKIIVLLIMCIMQEIGFNSEETDICIDNYLHLNKVMIFSN